MKTTHVTRALAVGVALIMTLSSCTWLRRLAYEGFGRDGWQQPERVIGELGLAPGSRVADLGAGGGYFTFRLADAVGDGGKVYAVDVDPGMLQYLEERTAEQGYENVDTVLAEYDDPLLPKAGVDLIFSCNTYHHLEDRPAYFKRASKYLAADGRIAIIEYTGEGWFNTLFGHSTSSEVIRSEMEAAGYRLQREHDFLSRQSFLIFSQ